MTLNPDQSPGVSFDRDQPGVVHIGGRMLPAVNTMEARGMQQRIGASAVLDMGEHVTRSALTPLENGRLVHVSHTSHPQPADRQWFVSAPDSVEVDEREGAAGYTTRMGSGTSGYLPSVEAVHQRMAEVASLPSPGPAEQERNKRAVQVMRSRPDVHWAGGVRS